MKDIGRMQIAESTTEQLLARRVEIERKASICRGVACYYDAPRRELQGINSELQGREGGR